MKAALKISTLLVLFIQTAVITAQQWEEPKPLMTHLILKNFLETHLEYPAKAIQNKEEGTVRIGFSTDKKGGIRERHIQQSVSPMVDASALRLFDLILWKPAKKYGLAVDCPANSNNGFSIKFNTKKYKKLIKKRGYDQLPQPYQAVDTSNIVFKTAQLSQKPTAILDSSERNINELIYRRIKYPEEASRLNITGNVRLSFIIETNGLPSNLIVKETVGGGCTEEAVGVVQQIKWVPGIKDQVAVRTQYELTITFKNPAHLKNKHIPNQANSGI